MHIYVYMHVKKVQHHETIHQKYTHTMLIINPAEGLLFEHPHFGVHIYTHIYTHTYEHAYKWACP